MKRYYFVFFLLAVISLFLLESCQNTGASGQQEEVAVQSSCEDLLTLPVLYQQTAAEYRALCYQAFNLARMQLDMDLRRAGLSLQQAIVTDIDETMLDNSPYEARCVKESVGYPKYWKEWMESASAEPVPGALEFLNYAESKGIEIFYITNRKEVYREPTLKNLKDAGFPFADDSHLLMRTDDNSKKARREKVSETHRIVMLIGDNLADFSEVYEGKSIEERNGLVDKNMQSFGTYFIVLPNVMYGDWVGTLYGNKKDMTEEEMKEMRSVLLKGF